MNPAAFSARRLRQLDAMGIVAYQLRRRTPVALAAQMSDTAAALPEAAAVRIAVISDQPRERTAGVLAAALGVADTALHWHLPRDGRLLELDHAANAFLVLGSHLARVLGAELPTTAQQAATIVVTAAPAQWRGDAMAKRLLWQALRPLRRQLREQTWSPS